MATTIGISLPFDLMVFALIYTMIKGRVRFTTPFLFNFGALVLFIVGGITGVFLGAVVLDYEFRGTYWVVAHFHYVMVGGATAMFGGLYYWYPKMTGKMYDEFLGKLHFALYFVGFNLLYFPQFVAWETPRRVFEYQPEFAIWHQLSTIGGFVLGFSFLIMFYNMGKSLYTGEDAGENPWAYTTSAEWAVPSPPPLENFPGLPSYGDGSLKFLRSTAPDGGTAETPTPVVSDPERSSLLAHHEDIHPDHASIWPLLISLAAALTFVGFAGLQLSTFVWPLLLFVPVSIAWMGVAQARHHGFGVVPVLVSLTGAAVAGGMAAEFVGVTHLFPEGGPGLGAFGGYAALASVGIVLGAISLVEMGAESFDVPEPPVASAWPFDGVEKTKLGMWFFLASDVVLFGGFIGSYLFIRFAYGWHHWHDYIPAEHVTLPGLLNTYILLVSSFAVVLALVAAEKESRAGVVASMVTTLVLGVAFLVNKAIEWIHLFHVEWVNYAGSQANIVHGWTFSTNIASSTFYLTTGLHGAHVTVGLLVLVWMTARAARGAYLDDERPIEYFGLYWHFVDIVWLFLFPLFYIV
jgi:cytochrome c oxidase subunit I+III